jgi:hypothetical protein
VAPVSLVRSDRDEAPGPWGKRPDGRGDGGDDISPGLDDGHDSVEEVIDVGERLAPYDGRVLRIPEPEPEADARCAAPRREPSREVSQLELWSAQDQGPALIDLRDVGDAEDGRRQGGPGQAAVRWGDLS